MDSGKQFQISVIRQEKDDLRQLITHNGLANFKLWPRKEEIWANSKMFLSTLTRPLITLNTKIKSDNSLLNSSVCKLSFDRRSQ